ncbi:MAG TPA: permease-like cell division protein FtsX [Burkholderiales bacterium]|nr:permease-like cell division protein FtsX [Burkholderiales bacterium]
MKRLLAYLARHTQALIGSVGTLVRAPLASLMTIAVIGITLALPTAMIVAVDNVVQLSSGWEGSERISLYLKRSVSEATVQKLADQLRRRKEIAKVEIITREQAFAEFKKQSGFGEALEALERNPLPTVLVVHPAAEAANPLRSLEELEHDLKKLDDVDLVQLDLDWVRRLHAWLGVIERGVLIAGGLLAIAVLLVVGNTIRLAVLSRRDEIEVSKLVGATDSFIRRPFLYSGLVQGLAGALLAWVLVEVGLLLLSGPVGELASLYGGGYVLSGLDIAGSATLFGAGALLGWLGARLAVGHHLRAIEPQ